MKKNREEIKKVLKNRIFIFVLGGLIFSAVSVYAATVFPSDDVTYDNTESGISSTNVQGAIDELYNTCINPPTGGNGILNKAPIVTTGDGLYEDEYEEGKYTYKGANPNNYITFNNEQAVWRIISINHDGTIKIMRTEAIGNWAWNSASSNGWYRASLNIHLNEDYYDSLTTIAQKQIFSDYYSVGGVADDNNDLANQVNGENSEKLNGKVALPTISEYIRSNSNKSSSGSLSLNSVNYSSCRNTTWMYIIDVWWTLSPHSSSSDDVLNVGFIGDVGLVYIDFADTLGIAVRPSVYLSSKIKITGGDGSSSDPYQISL